MSKNNVVPIYCIVENILIMWQISMAMDWRLNDTITWLKDFLSFAFEKIIKIFW